MPITFRNYSPNLPIEPLPEPGVILQEDGGDVLLEDGGKIVKEE